jgi:hypothetical protein
MAAVSAKSIIRALSVYLSGRMTSIMRGTNGRWPPSTLGNHLCNFPDEIP